jgi:RNA polymerase sigma-70 factor, ECF subfamily
VLDRAVLLRRPGPYQLLAAIAACHARAPTAASTDWREITLLYDRLSEIAPTPVVSLNRAVAVAMAEGPAAGLALVDELERTGALSDYYLLAATRADLLRRLGRNGEAAAGYHRAFELVAIAAERRFLLRRLAEVSGCPPY